jgi:hypothetical protein
MAPFAASIGPIGFGVEIAFCGKEALEGTRMHPFTPEVAPRI